MSNAYAVEIAWCSECGCPLAVGETCHPLTGRVADIIILDDSDDGVIARRAVEEQGVGE